MFSSKRDMYSSWSARCGYCDQKRHTRYRVKLNYMHGCRERMQRTDAPVKSGASPSLVVSRDTHCMPRCRTCGQKRHTRFKFARSHYREVVTERKGRTTWVLLLLLLLLLLYDSLKKTCQKAMSRSVSRHKMNIVKTSCEHCSFVVTN